MIEPSKPRAPTIVRTVSQDQIDRGQRLQESMEEIDAQVARELAEEARIELAARVEQERLAGIEETRRAASAGGKLMDARYGYINNMKG